MIPPFSGDELFLDDATIVWGRIIHRDGSYQHTPHLAPRVYYYPQWGLFITTYPHMCPHTSLSNHHVDVSVQSTLAFSTEIVLGTLTACQKARTWCCTARTWCCTASTQLIPTLHTVPHGMRTNVLYVPISHMLRYPTRAVHLHLFYAGKGSSVIVVVPVTVTTNSLPIGTSTICNRHGVLDPWCMRCRISWQST